MIGSFFLRYKVTVQDQQTFLLAKRRMRHILVVYNWSLYRKRHHKTKLSHDVLTVTAVIKLFM